MLKCIMSDTLQSVEMKLITKLATECDHFHHGECGSWSM